MTDENKLVTVAVLVFPETNASVIFGMYDLFMSAGREWDVILGGEPGPQLMRPLLVSAHPGPMQVNNGVPITPHSTLAECPPVDIVCVPDINLPPGQPLEAHYAAEIAWIKQKYAQGVLIATACSGSMMLADANLLDGLDATSHWAWCPAMSQRHPTVKVRERSALIVTGEGQRLVMAGGGTTWLDLALYLVARSVGVQEAMHVARINLIDWHSIGQQPFARLARTRQVEDAVIARCQTWVAEHYQEPNPVKALVRLSGLAERSFKRRFQNATGMSPLEYVHALRIEEAKQMLESGDEPIEAIAHEVGYENAAFFTRLFRRKVNLSPTEYRRRFGALRRSLAVGDVG